MDKAIKTMIFTGVLSVFCGLVFAQELTLDSCRNMALRHNKGVLISEQMLQAAQETRKATFTRFLPDFNAIGAYMYNSRGNEMSVLSHDATLPVGSLDANGKFTYNLDPQKGSVDVLTNSMGYPIDSRGRVTTNPNEMIPRNVAYMPKEALAFDMSDIFVAGIGFTQPIFMGGKILEMYKISRYAENVAKIKYDNDNINVMIEVDEAFWRVVSLQEKKELATEYYNLLLKTYNDVDQMFKQGMITKADLLNVQVKLNESEMTLTKAENGLRLAKMMLNQICGMEFNYDYTLVDRSDQTSMDLVENSSIKQDISQRNEALLLEQSVNIAKSGLKIARSRFMPNIVAQGNYLVSNPSLFNGFDTKFKGSFVIGVGLTVPIFHFGERIHTLKAAKHTLKIAEITREEKLEQMELQANMRQNTRNEAVKQNIIASNTMDHAIENLRQAEIGFKEGIIATTDLMAAQTSYVSAKSELIDAKINLMLSDLYLNQSLGRIVNPNK